MYVYFYQIMTGHQILHDGGLHVWSSLLTCQIKDLLSLSSPYLVADRPSWAKKDILQLLLENDERGREINISYQKQ